ncbi:MAG: RNA methyltransferase, partial [Vagococcus sp.]
MKEIESIKNERIKNYKKLEKKKYRDSEGVYLLEGEHLVEEAINYEAQIEALLIAKDNLLEFSNLTDKIDSKKIIVVT